MNKIYKAIIDRLHNNETFFTNADLEPVRHIDKYRGQYDTPQEHEAFAVPAVFVRWAATWKDLSVGVQQGTINLELHIVLENNYSAAAGSSDLEQALKIDEYYSRVNALIHGLKGEQFSALKRRTDQPDNQPTNVLAHITTYECTYTDDSAYIYQGFILANPNSIEINNSVMQRGEFNFRTL